ncbi:MAG: GAF domain-containing protein [Candidatus Riflebacteria bacterium]|nr:GAF domain-containing protein [Candidatus Riflebacteria bacterium]
MTTTAPKATVNVHSPVFNIRTKMFLGMLLLIFCLVFSLSYFQLEIERNVFEDNIKTKSLMLVKIIEALNIGEFHQANQGKLLKIASSIISQTSRNNELLNIAFFSPQSIKIAEANSSDVTPGENSIYSLTQKVGIEVNRSVHATPSGDPIGFIQMTFSVSTYNDVQNRIIKVNILLAFAFAFVAYFASMLFSRLILAPVESLIESTKNAAEGKLALIPDNHSRDEFASLIRSFNDMIEGIKRAIGDLSQKNTLLDKKVYELSTLHQAGRIINSVLNLDRLYEVIVDTTIQMLGGVKRCSLMLASLPTGEFVIKIAKGLDVGLLPTSRRVPITRGISGKVFQTGEAIIINDLKEDEAGNVLEKTPVVRSSICVPLKVNEEIIGIISASNKISGDPFRQEDLNLMETLSMQAGVAIKNAKLYHDLDRKILELATLHEVGKSLNMVLELDKLLEMILENTARVLGGVKSSSLILFDEDTNMLNVKVFKGLNRECTKKPIRIGEGIAGKVFEKGEPMLINNLSEENITDPASGSGVRSSLCVPLQVKKRKLGVLSVSDKLSGESFDNNDLDMLFTLASQIAITINNAKLYEDLEASYLAAVRALANSLDAKDPYTLGHSERVALYSVEIGKKMALLPQQIKDLHIGALLHDIGKIGISENIINKSTRLTSDEFELIKTHPARGASIIEPAKFLKEKIPLIKNHHERYDGKGYPDGLKGEKIPLLARIVCVADSYDAMTSKRAYRDNIGNDAATAELLNCAGTQFDPAVVDAFVELLKDESLSEEIEKLRKS